MSARENEVQKIAQRHGLAIHQGLPVAGQIHYVLDHVLDLTSSEHALLRRILWLS